MGLAPAEAGAGRPARRPGGTWRRWARLTGLAAWIALVLAAAMPHPAQAYIDPATTSYLIQVVSGLVITLSVAIGVFFRRIVLFLTTARARLAATWVRLTSPRRRPAKGSAAQAAANPSPTASALAAGAAAGPRAPPSGTAGASRPASRWGKAPPAGPSAPPAGRLG
ncbi:MAG: hypothetical protein LBD51_00110 [Bifidobacteriaceae bacterium]|jgi:hypothetical protein|nr:hypothetical protein [Bifidobacteriaceae bacterium]